MFPKDLLLSFIHFTNSHEAKTRLKRKNVMSDIMTNVYIFLMKSKDVKLNLDKPNINKGT